MLLCRGYRNLLATLWLGALSWVGLGKQHAKLKCLCQLESLNPSLVWEAGCTDLACEGQAANSTRLLGRVREKQTLLATSSLAALSSSKDNLLLLVLMKQQTEWQQQACRLQTCLRQ